MQKIVTCLGFDTQAEEAVHFYTSVFRNSKILSITRHGDATPGPNGTLLAATFELDGQEFMALNGGPNFTFSLGMSVVVRCEDQAEVDRLWEKLTDGGQAVACGWLTDRFGVSWQIVPKAFFEMISDRDPRKSQAALGAMLTMTKLDLAKLKEAYDGAVREA